MLSDGENTYKYDSANRVSEVITKLGDIQRNHYDGEGLRAELEENGKLVSFIFNDDKVVTEQSDNITVRYIRGYDIISSDSESAIAKSCIYGFCNLRITTMLVMSLAVN